MKARVWEMFAVLNGAGSIHSVEPTIRGAKLVAGFHGYAIIPVLVTELKPKRRRK